MNGFDFFFSVFPVLFFGMFVLVGGFILFVIIKSISQHRKDDHSPRLSADATVVAKRTHVWGDHAHTNYYATFQVPSGDRMELQVPHNEFGYLVEGDRGQLTFQGTRYLGFQRY